MMSRNNKLQYVLTLIIRKLLASSTWALLQTLETIRDRLFSIRNGALDANSDLDNLFNEDGYALIDEILDETDEDDLSGNDGPDTRTGLKKTNTPDGSADGLGLRITKKK